MPRTLRSTCIGRFWKTGDRDPPPGPVHVSMNDYMVHRVRDIPRVARAALGLRRSWPRLDGALGLWLATFDAGRRQVSVSVWREPQDLRRFVLSPAHRRVMRDFRGAGDLITTTWTADRCDRALIWSQAEDRLLGRLEGVPHH